MSSTVWDFDPSLPAPPHEAVDGKVASGSGLNLGIFADLAVSIGHLSKQVQRQQDRLDKLAELIPGDYQNAAAGIYPASGVLSLNLGSPDQGQYWSVRRVVVGGSDITTSPGGVAYMVVMGSPPNQNGSNVNLAQVADISANGLPQKAFYGSHELVVGAGESLYCVITGGTSTTQYVASCKCEVFRLDQRAEPVWGM